ncbi:MAG: tetratricopeptide repeat protein [Proteobacteria bacterium]|nr:tetratricopeptide repeat protein [Pseudomonadota bacterium]
MTINTVVAYSFPFREFEEGDPVPDVTLQNYEQGKDPISFSKIKGNPFVAVFWGADMPEKMKHAAETLKEVHALAPFLAERNIRLFSVNIQGDVSTIIDTVISQSTDKIPVYLDQDRVAYGTLGVFVMPAVLVVDKDGKVFAGMGYSHDMVDRLKGAIEIMLGEKTKEQVEAELHPEMIEKSAEEKAGNRHLNFGLVLLKRGLQDPAIREFEKALEVNPELNQARIELSCLYLDKGQLDEAQGAISKGLELEPDSLRGKICLGKIKLKKGQLADAAADFKAIQNDNPGNHESHYYLGKVYEEQKLLKEAMAEYKLAFEILQKEIRAKDPDLNGEILK